MKWDPKKIIVYSGLIHVRQFDLVPFIVIGGTRGHGCSGYNDSQMTWVGRVLDAPLMVLITYGSDVDIGNMEMRQRHAS